MNLDFFNFQLQLLLVNSILDVLKHGALFAVVLCMMRKAAHLSAVSQL